ncbi:unnamed protein product, partial [Allacma fusca]
NSRAAVSNLKHVLIMCTDSFSPTTPTEVRELSSDLEVQTTL